MRKKLNRKLKFALAGFGAFALAGVSCVGLASLESQDAIASYAIVTPTDGNPVVNGVFTFTYAQSLYEYYCSCSDLIIYSVPAEFFTGDLNIRFSSDSYGSTYGTVNLSSSDWSYSDGNLVLNFSSVILNNPTFSYIGSYWRLSSSTSTIRFSSVEYASFIVTGDSSPYVADPYIPVPPTPVDYVHDIVDILVAGITNLGQGIGQGVSSFVQSLAFNSAGTGLSVYFVLVCVFGGIALAVALTSKIFMWLNGLGA